jgi:tRNA(Ile)-lysidine synthase
MEALVERVAERLDRLAPPDAPVVLAVSGGPDSLAMLDLLARGAALHRRTLVVGHVDHGIDPSSATVAESVRVFAESLGVATLARTLRLGADATETTARRARRGALRSIARECGAGAIALGHHRNDQVETVLLRCLAGSGPHGLAGMAPRRGIWVRPMLDVDPRVLHDYLATRGLSGWQDPANADPRHLRSWLRIVALPLLRERIVGLDGAVLRVAGHAGENRVAWNQLLEELDELELQVDRGTISVAAPPLRRYRSAVQAAVLSALGRRLGVTLGAHRLAAVRQVLLSERSGALVALGPRCEAELSFDRLVLRRPVQVIDGMELPEQGELRAGDRLFTVRLGRADRPAVRGAAGTLLRPGRYRVRSWRAGDRIRPLGGTGSRSVAELFKEARVPAGSRRGWPLLVSADDDATVVWVPGICRSGSHLPESGKDAMDVECDLA